MIGQGIFCGYIAFKDVAEPWLKVGQGGEFKIGWFAKADNINPFAVLWNRGARINHFGVDKISQFLLKRPADDLECSAFVVTF